MKKAGLIRINTDMKQMNMGKTKELHKFANLT